MKIIYLEALMPKAALPAKVKAAPSETANAAKYGIRTNLEFGWDLHNGLVVDW